MTHTQPTLADRFAGCLLGLAIGDAVGAQYEGQSADFISRRFGSVKKLLENIPPNGLYYTDDTQMAIGVAETLVTCGRIDETEICKRFAENYVPHRGYEHAIGNAILLGGDTDTIAAMAGAVSGSYLGRTAIPIGLIGNLENHHQGRGYIEELAIQLSVAHSSCMA